MALIPGGYVALGIDAEEVAHFQALFRIDRRELFDAEIPKHSVELPLFYLDKARVTNAQFFSFIQAKSEWGLERVQRNLDNGNYLKHWSNNQVPTGQENHPVVNVTWYAAVAYCQWKGKRLPTEAEWEHAARGGGNGLYPWGNAPADPALANYSASGFGTTTVVSMYPPNGYGLLTWPEMSGNLPRTNGLPIPRHPLTKARQE